MAMQLATVVGARPQFIKLAAVSRWIRETTSWNEILVHTGQHYDHGMSEVFFEELNLPAPAHHLGVGSGGHGQQTGRMMEALENLWTLKPPDAVLVYGDTNSTLAGALTAAKLHIPVVHVEAGLRSFNRRMPEEINRVLTDHLSALLFAPTPVAIENLRREGIEPARIVQSGDVMYDAALYFGERAEDRSRVLKTCGLGSKGYLLATVHRAENTDVPERLEALLGGLRAIARDVPVVLPLHPRTLARLGAGSEALRGLRILEPVGYLDMIQLEKHASLIVTDSGGVQKEAFFHEVPCVTLRDETEWTELVDLGWNRLVPPTSATVVEEGIRASLGTRGREGRPYGEGRASSVIVEAMARHFA